MTRPYSPGPFWTFATTFFSFLDDKSRGLLENFWHGLWIAADSLYDLSLRLNGVEGLSTAITNTSEPYFELKVSVYNAVPLNLNPTQKSPNHMIVPKSILFRQPEYDYQLRAIHRDLVEISQSEYNSIRDIILERGSDNTKRIYMVVIPSKKSTVPRSFVIKQGLSSLDDPLSATYWPPATSSTSSYRFFLECEDCDMTFVGNDKFSIYLTTGRSFYVSDTVKTIPSLNSNVGIYDPDETVPTGFKFVDGDDYVFSTGSVEFVKDLFLQGVKEGSTLYCEIAETQDSMLYSMYGSMVNIRDRFSLSHYTNEDTKAAIAGLNDALQHISDVTSYERALNINYGLPVSPGDGVVLGLYESFDYNVIAVDSLSVQLEIQEDRELHNFFQPGVLVLVNGTTELKITQVNIDRTLAIIGLGIDHGVVVGDKINIELPGAYKVYSMMRDVSEIGDAFIEVYAEEENERLHYMITTYNQLTGEWPEVCVYGTSGLDVVRNGKKSTHDGIYHMTGVQKILLANSKSGLRISLYNVYSEDEPRYHDYVFATTNGLDRGFAHFNWPTHKYLLIDINGKNHKAMIDAPVDTMLKKLDSVKQYQPLCSSVLVATYKKIPAWNELNEFRSNNGIDLENGVLELTATDPGSLWGRYFPSEYQPLVE